MFVKRLFPSRWAKIMAWTGAALAWGSVTVAGAQSNSPQEPAADTGTPAALPTTTSTITTALPEPPAAGLVIIRYTHVAPPAPEVIVTTVTRTKPGAVSPTSKPKVKSSGS
jgi:hypothetical protein